VVVLAVPHLGDPDRVGVCRIFRDDIAQAARHVGNAFEQDLDQRVALTRDGGYLPDQSVHRFPFLIRSAHPC
jgi:hypothetical protein